MAEKESKTDDTAYDHQRTKIIFTDEAMAIVHEKTIENEWKDAPYEYIYSTYPEIPAYFVLLFNVPFEYHRAQC